jgi:dihydroorotate dehydrogenase
VYRLIRALLFLLPAEAAHRLGMRALALLSRFPRACERSRGRRLGVREVDLSCELAGLKLAHPIGLAAGLDKDAEAVAGLFALGFAAVEIGTVTPRPQPGNPKPRIFRIPEHQALINRLGFNNHGAAEAAARLRALTFWPGPVGVNLGKNKDTPLERAVEDYVACVETLAPLGDYVVVNASSPNTPGLRTLQEPEQLARLLSAVREKLDAVGRKPLFLKIAPDLALEAVDAIVDVALGCRVDGLIATNTTITRPVEHPVTKQAGGLSGAPLGPLSLLVLQRASSRAAGRLALVGVGGIMNGADAYARLRAGASAVQLYTGFIYGGPNTVKRALGELEACLRRDGFRSVREAIGAR